MIERNIVDDKLNSSFKLIEVAHDGQGIHRVDQRQRETETKSGSPG